VSKTRGPAKTNAARRLDELGLPYELLAFQAPPDDLSAETAARLLGLPEAMVYKTLVLAGPRGGHVEACLPAGRDLDLKALARAAGERSLELAPVARLFELVGYKRGGCSPLGGRRQFPVFVHDEALGLAQMAVNAGARGLMLLLTPQALIAAAEARTAPIAGPPKRA
jgi:Cys-tRNA(Pro)/Cys-tRNA(Cys) deacylase